MQKTKERTERTDEPEVHATTADAPAKRDFSDIDALLDDIDEVLETPEQEALDRLSYAAKLKSWARNQTRLDRVALQNCEGQGFSVSHEDFAKLSPCGHCL